MPLAGVLCASDIWGGWPSVFYVFGKYFPCNTVNKDPSSWVYLIVNDDISIFRDISSGDLDITDILLVQRGWTEFRYEELGMATK